MNKLTLFPVTRSTWLVDNPTTTVESQDYHLTNKDVWVLLNINAGQIEVTYSSNLFLLTIEQVPHKDAVYCWKIDILMTPDEVEEFSEKFT